MSKYKFILYRSFSNLDVNEVTEIQNQAYTNNIDHKITGVLFYISGNFLQYIEGKAENIDYLYHHILKDMRHYHVKLLSMGEIDARLFPNWKMGFKYISKEEVEHHFPKAIDAKGIEALFSNQPPSYYIELMKNFYENDELDFSKFWNE